MCVHACVCAFVNFFFKKKLLSETIAWTYTKFHSSVPKRLKSSLHHNRKIRPVERYRRSSASSYCFLACMEWNFKVSS